MSIPSYYLYVSKIDYQCHDTDKEPQGAIKVQHSDASYPNNKLCKHLLALRCKSLES